MASNAPKVGAAALFAVIALLTIWLALDDWMRTQLVVSAHRVAPVLLPLAAVIALGVIAVACFSNSNTAFLGAIVALVAVGTLVASVVYWSQYNYHVKRSYLASVTVVTDEVPTMAERAAHTVANRQAKSLIGDVRGEFQPMKFVPGAGADTFNALVTKPGVFTGYQVVEVGTFDLTGTGTATTCEFSEYAGKRLGGHFAGSLDRAIAAAAPGTFFDKADAYGFCQDETPKVVIPLKKLSGLLHVTQVPAGVAVYDGHTGKVEVLDTVADGDLPGPVFPMSLAAEVRASTEASGGYWDYIKSRAGYDVAADEEDPNVRAGNVAEFNMAYASGSGAAYITSLTPKGQGETNVAVAEISSSTHNAGKLNQLTLHKLSTSRVPGAAIAKNILGDYGDLPEWAAGMSIFEIAPVDQERFVASLGQNQAIAYRVYIKADGSSCLSYADGTKLRCGKVTGTNGNSVGGALQPEPGSGPQTSLPAPGADLSNLSDAELAQLLANLSTEAARRLQATS